MQHAAGVEEVKAPSVSKSTTIGMSGDCVRMTTSMNSSRSGNPCLHQLFFLFDVDSDSCPICQKYCGVRSVRVTSSFSSTGGWRHRAATRRGEEHLWRPLAFSSPLLPLGILDYTRAETKILHSGRAEYVIRSANQALYARGKVWEND